MLQRYNKTWRKVKMKRIKLAKNPSMNISERIFRIAIYATGLFLKKSLALFR